MSCSSHCSSRPPGTCVQAVSSASSWGGFPGGVPNPAEVDVGGAAADLHLSLSLSRKACILSAAGVADEVLDAAALAISVAVALASCCFLAAAARLAAVRLSLANVLGGALGCVQLSDGRLSAGGAAGLTAVTSSTGFVFLVLAGIADESRSYVIVTSPCSLTDSTLK